uniref:Putative secreted protein n=1 Tax=Ixodes scapularis TaxID=6945 RepID=A0A4D5S1L2_IXOSC
MPRKTTTTYRAGTWRAALAVFLLFAQTIFQRSLYLYQASVSEHFARVAASCGGTPAALTTTTTSFRCDCSGHHLHALYF